MAFYQSHFFMFNTNYNNVSLYLFKQSQRLYAFIATYYFEFFADLRAAISTKLRNSD